MGRRLALLEAPVRRARAAVRHARSPSPRSLASQRSRSESGWEPWCWARRSATRRCWRRPSRRWTRSARGGSTSASAPAGSRTSSRRSATGTAPWGSASPRSRRRSGCWRRCWTGPRPRARSGSVELKSARLLPPPVQRPRPPVWVGGGGPWLLRLAARHADGWNVVWRMTPTDYAGKVDDVAAACEAEGRDPASFRRSVGLYGLTRRTRPRWPRCGSVRGPRCRDGRSTPSPGRTGGPTRCRARPSSARARGGVRADGRRGVILSPWSLPFALPDRRCSTSSPSA